jgi:para-aminobenzoate synthetase component I
MAAPGESARHYLERLLPLAHVRPADGLPALIGFLGYELGAASERVSGAPTEPNDPALPPASFAAYSHWIVHDYTTGETTLQLGPSDDSAAFAAQAEALLSAPDPALAFHAAPVAADQSREAYLSALARIRAYIATGDVYQVNYTQRFSAAFAGSAAALHLALRAHTPAPFATYLDLGDIQLVSASPERFLQKKGRLLETRPIKGTLPRSLANATADEAAQAELLASEKDNAELLMIVDLMRNDLGRVCAAGSVRVDERRRAETHPTVHHLVATVSGELRAECGLVEALAALLPGGSITGAPKVRAMQIIAELEPVRRHAYCGALGWIGGGADPDADFAIPIRTITVARGRASYHVGSGVVWDSDPAAEYAECLAKGRALQAALATGAPLAANAL